MPSLTYRDLDSFVAFVDEHGGELRSEAVSQRYQPFHFKVESTVDHALSPYDPAYFDQMLAVYREISGRELDQWSGELHPVNVESLVGAANPHGSGNTAFMAENVRALAAMLSIVGLRAGAQVLDMGAGNGTSSEVYAFCGANVHAVDIDPGFTELSLRRAERRGLPIRRSLRNYDALHELESGLYDAAFFFQSLHHALRPWTLVEELRRTLRSDGVIAFCGEPIQDDPWPNWGLRLDIESVYVARKYGWFESGWSRPFIRDCFMRAGLHFEFLRGGHAGGLIGVAALSQARLLNVITRAGSLGHDVALEDGALDARYRSQVGLISDASRLGGFVHSLSPEAVGYLLFGPYIKLEPGTYEVTFLLRLLNPTAANPGPFPCEFDVISDTGQSIHHRSQITLSAEGSHRWVREQIDLPFVAHNVEARLRLDSSGSGWEASLPRFERIQP
jgi:SAM-dependent methyltransferase